MAEDIFNIKIKAQDAYSSALKRMESNYAKAAIAIGGSIATIGAGLIAITTQTARAGDEFLKWSKTTGVAVKSLSELSYATKVLGGDQEKLFDVLKETAVRMKEAQDGTGPLRDNLKHLGIEFQNVDGTLRDTETVFFEIVNSLNQLENQALKVAIADEIWSDAGTELLNVLGQDKQAIEDLRKEARDLNLVFDQESAEAARKFNENLERTKSTLQGLTVTVGTYLLPKFNEFIAAWEDGFRNIIGREKTESSTEKLKRLTAEIDEERKKLEELGREYQTVSVYDGFRRQSITQQTEAIKSNIAVLNQQRAAIVQSQKATSVETDTGPGLSGRLKLEEDLARQIRQINFDIDQELLSAQYQAEAVAYEARQQAINDEIAQYNDKFEQEWNLIVQQNEVVSRAGLERYNYQEYLRKKDLADTKKNERLKLMAMNHGASQAVSLLENLNTIAGEKHKGYFEVLKVARIAEATINTYTGATRAFAEYPWPYSAIVAGLVTAAGIAQIFAIQSQQFSGSGSSSVSASVSSGGSAPSQNNTFNTGNIPIAATAANQEQSNVGLTVIIQNPLGTEDWDKVVEENIAPAIRRATDRNITITS